MADLPILLFLKSRIVMDSIPDDKLPIDEEEAGQFGIFGTDVFVFPLEPENKNIPITLDYIEHAEAVSILPEVSENPDWQMMDPDDRPDSYHVARRVSRPYSETEPAFGRKMLIVNYDDDPDDGAIERAAKAIRRALGRNVAVWHGRRFEAYCFVDTRPVAEVRRELTAVLSAAEVCDYLIVQPISMVKLDPSGLSPLGDWLDRGWRIVRGQR